MVKRNIGELPPFELSGGTFLSNKLDGNEKY